jgi:hypothetical protein
MELEAILAIFFGMLFTFSEGLALIPWVKSNSIFQLIQNILKSLAGKNAPKSE